MALELFYYSPQTNMHAHLNLLANYPNTSLSTINHILNIPSDRKKNELNLYGCDWDSFTAHWILSFMLLDTEMNYWIVMYLLIESGWNKNQCDRNA